MAMELSMWTCRCGSTTAEEKHTDIPAISPYHARTLYTYNTPHTCATHHTIPHLYTWNPQRERSDKSSFQLTSERGGHLGILVECQSQH